MADLYNPRRYYNNNNSRAAANSPNNHFANPFNRRVRQTENIHHFPAGHYQPSFHQTNQGSGQYHQSYGRSRHQGNMNRGAHYPNNTAGHNPYGTPQPSQPYSDPSVTFEPLDKKMMAQIRAGQTSQAQMSGQGAASLTSQNPGIVQDQNDLPSVSKPFRPYIDQSVIDLSPKLVSIMQNEKNGAKYYSLLAESAPKEISGIFSAIKTEGEGNLRRLSELYHILNNKEAELADPEIYLPGGLRQNLFLALNEESASLADIREVIEEEQSEKTIKFLGDISFRKIMNINKLFLLLLQN